MAFQLPRWKSSDPALEEALNILADGVERAVNKRFHAGVNATIIQDENDVIFEAEPGGEGGGGSPTIRPFDIEVFKDGAVIKAKVIPGVFGGGFIPTNMYADFPIDDTGIYIAKVKVTTDGKKITSSLIIIDVAQAPIQNPAKNMLPTEFHFVFGVIFKGVAYRTLGNAGPTIASQLLYTTSRTDAQPGELPFDNWYIWKVVL